MRFIVLFLITFAFIAAFDFGIGRPEYIPVGALSSLIAVATFYIVERLFPSRSL